MTVRAVYADGALHPVEPLALKEGEIVEVTIAQTNWLGPPMREPTSAERDYAQRISEAKSLKEMFAAMATAPLSPDDELDVVKSINDSRRLTGFRLPETDPAEENSV